MSAFGIFLDVYVLVCCGRKIMMHQSELGGCTVPPQLYYNTESPVSGGSVDSLYRFLKMMGNIKYRETR